MTDPYRCELCGKHKVVPSLALMCCQELKGGGDDCLDEERDFRAPPSSTAKARARRKQS